MSERAKEMKYPAFQEKYISLVSGDVFKMLADQKEQFGAFIDSLNDTQLDHRYEEGKWSIREVLIHIMDTEQIFNYRALCTARGEKGILPGFDQDVYMSQIQTEAFSREYLLNYFTITRYNSLVLFKSFSPEQWDTLAHIDDYEMSLSAFPYMAAGHLQHHWNILKTRYL